MRPLRPALVLPLVLTVALSGCGWMNPKNWFGSEPVAQTLEPEGGYQKAREDGRELVPQITALKIERTLTGAIVVATGLPPTQGWWGSKLVAENDGLPVDGVITYRFVLAEPASGSADAGRVLNERAREVTATAFIRGPRLAQTTQVVVVGAANSRSASR